jgi:DNA replication protein DnaC
MLLRSIQWVGGLVNRVICMTKQHFLTSTKCPGEWGRFLGDTTLTIAILDRLLHRNEILTFSEEQDSIRRLYIKTFFDNQSVES